METTKFAQLTLHEEQVLMPLVKQILAHRDTKQKVFSNIKIRKVLREFGEEIHDRQIRKIIYYLRVNHLLPLLIANTEGYYVTNNKEDVVRWIEMQKSKISAMHQTINAIEEQYQKKLQELIEGTSDEMKGQLSLYDFI
jgi:hypothetical protein